MHLRIEVNLLPRNCSAVAEQLRGLALDIERGANLDRLEGTLTDGGGRVILEAVAYGVDCDA